MEPTKILFHRIQNVRIEAVTFGFGFGFFAGRETNVLGLTLDWNLSIALATGHGAIY